MNGTSAQQEPAGAAATAVLDGPAAEEAPPDDVVLAEYLVEEVSIDGMCGVY